MHSGVIVERVVFIHHKSDTFNTLLALRQGCLRRKFRGMDDDFTPENDIKLFAYYLHIMLEPK